MVERVMEKERVNARFVQVHARNPKCFWDKNLQVTEVAVAERKKSIQISIKVFHTPLHVGLFKLVYCALILIFIYA